MKQAILLAILVTSVGANVYFLARDNRTVTASAAARTATAASPETTATAANDAAVADRDTVQLPTWNGLATTDDFKRLADQMRSAGYPGFVIRAVVERGLTARFAQDDPTAQLPFWHRYGADPETQKRQREFAASREKELLRILGPTAVIDALDPIMRESRYGPLSDEKIMAITALQREYNELRQSHINRRSNTFFHDDPDLAKMRAFDEEFAADMKIILTPQELEEYNRRSDRSASTVMNAAKGLSLNEVEYDTLWRLQEKLTQKYPTFSGSIDWAEHGADTDTMLAEARKVLGEDRFLLYLEAHQPSYLPVKRFIDEKKSDMSGDQRIALFQANRDLASLSFRRAQPGAQFDAAPELAKLTERVRALLGPNLAEAYFASPHVQSNLRMLGATPPKP